MQACASQLWTEKTKLAEDTLSTERVVWVSLGLCAMIEGTAGLLGNDIEGANGAIIALSIVLIVILVFRVWIDSRDVQFPTKCDLNNLWYRHWSLIPPALLLVFVILFLAFVDSTGSGALGFEVFGGVLMLCGAIAAWITRLYCCVPEGSEDVQPEPTIMAEEDYVEAEA